MNLTWSFTLLAWFAVRPACFAQAQSRPAVQSPEIHSDSRVTFRLWAPKAAEVSLRGDWMPRDADLRMRKNNEGVWSVTAGPFAPDRYTYRFHLDGVAITDPANPRIKLNERAASSMLEVPGESPVPHDARGASHGTVHVNSYWSSTLEATRSVYVYTPPGYESSTGRYPVLYLFHGTSDFESAWTRVGRANFILDNLIAESRAKPMIVVMPYGRAYPKVQPSEGSLGYWRNIQLFQEELFHEIIPLVEGLYRARVDRESRAIAGLSGGGGESLAIGLSNLDRFAWVAGFSSAIREAEFDRNFAAVKQAPERANRMLKLLWIGCGEDDHLFEANEAFVKWLTALKVNHIYRRTEGAHTWMIWRRYLAEIAPKLFREEM